MEIGGEAWNVNDLEKPDLKKGAPLASIPDGGKLPGVVDGEEVLLVRRGPELFAVGQSGSMSRMDFQRRWQKSACGHVSGFSTRGSRSPRSRFWTTSCLPTINENQPRELNNSSRTSNCWPRLPPHLIHPPQDDRAVAVHALGPSLQRSWQDCS